MRNVFLFAIALALCLPLAAQIPPSQHVYIVLEENHSFEGVVGQMPYLNGLAAQNVLLVNSFANGHFSIPNYMFLTTGQSLTLDDGTQLTFNVDNIVRHLQTGGKTWKAYEEGIPSAGYTGSDLPAGCGAAGNPCSYVKHHDPFAYLVDVVNSNEALNIVPFSQLAADIANNTLPNYAFITPTLQDDGHDGPLSVADSWLQNNIGPLLATPAFQPGGDGLLIITFDEGLDSDCRPLASCPPLPEIGGGGRIYTVVIGPQVKHGYQSSTVVNHNAILRLMEQALGIASTGYPGAAASAPDLTDIFPGSPSPTPTPTPTPTPSPTPSPTPTAGVTVSLSSPANGATVPAGQLLQISASASSNHPITGWRAYANGVNVATGGAANTFSAQVSLATGTYTLIVKAWDSTGAIGQQTVSISVGTSPPPSTPTVSITSPASGASVTSPVVVSATFKNGGTAQYMKVWVDGVAKYVVNNVTSITTPGIALGSGSHRITVQAYTGTLYSSTENVTVP